MSGVPSPMTLEHRHHDIREYFTAICEHRCESRCFTVSDLQGTNASNTFIGYACACGEVFRCALMAVKCVRVPLRPYISTIGARTELIARIEAEPEILLAEMQHSGGWDQPDPGVAYMTLMAAACGPDGNPMEERLKAMMAPIPTPPKGVA